MPIAPHECAFLLYLWSHHLMRVWARSLFSVGLPSAPWVSAISRYYGLLPWKGDDGHNETCRIKFMLACIFGACHIRVNAHHPNPIVAEASLLASLYGDPDQSKLFLGTLRIWML